LAPASASQFRCQQYDAHWHNVLNDAGWLRRDLINSKVMGFNAISFYGLPDALFHWNFVTVGADGLRRAYSSQLYEDSPQMVERFDRSTREMILRDRKSS